MLDRKFTLLRKQNIWTVISECSYVKILQCLRDRVVLHVFCCCYNFYSPEKFWQLSFLSRRTFSRLTHSIISFYSSHVNIIFNLFKPTPPIMYFYYIFVILIFFRALRCGNSVYSYLFVFYCILEFKEFVSTLY